MEEMTLEEAIKRGYTKFLYADEGWQTLHDLSDVDDEDFARGVMLVEKEPTYPGIDKDSLVELIAEDIQVNHADQTGDDGQEVYEIIKALDFSATHKMITDALSSYPIYESSGIKLIKE